MEKKNTDTHTIYISNLKFTLDEGHILGLFKKYGYVKNINMLMEGKDNKFKGVAFVDMVNLKNVEKAISELNGLEKFGRTLKVSLASNQNFTPAEEKREFKPKKSVKTPKAEINMTKKIRRSNPKNGLKALFSSQK